MSRSPEPTAASDPTPAAPAPAPSAASAAATWNTVIVHPRLFKRLQCAGVRMEGVVPDWRCVPVDRCGSAALMRLENKHVALLTANAYVSTLGGGHFLCRHVPSAVALARAQIRVACELGDTHLAARSHIHLAYCAVLMGQFRSASRLLALLDRVAVALEDPVLAGMVVAARRHTRMTHALWRTGALRFAAPHREEIITEEQAMEREATQRFTAALLRVASPHGRPSDIDRHDELFRLHLVPVPPR